MSAQDPDTPGLDSTPTPRVAVVTGGARGLGQACAVRLAERGYDIAIADLIEPIETANAVRSTGARRAAPGGSPPSPPTSSGGHPGRAWPTT